MLVEVWSYKTIINANAGYTVYRANMGTRLNNRRVTLLVVCVTPVLCHTNHSLQLHFIQYVRHRRRMHAQRYIFHGRSSYVHLSIQSRGE